MDLLAAMRAFVAVAETGRFTAASGRLGLSRAMPSRQVIDLEAHLGVRLLHRTTRKLSLTEQGRLYLERCREILGAVEEAEEEIASQAAEPVGRLRVSAPTHLGASRIAPMVAAYVARHPRVSIDLALNDRIVDMVEEGYDLAIRVGRLADSTLIARRIDQTRLLCCASPAYLKAHGRPQRPEDLARHECVHYSYASAGVLWTFRTDDGETTVRVGGKTTCNNGAAICNMAIQGLGVVLQPDFLVSSHLKSGALEEILADYPQDPIGIYAVHPSRSHTPLKVRLFIDYLSTDFKATRGEGSNDDARSEPHRTTNAKP
jgi:DNA-binding transcriptional LysR family regulator